MMFLRKCLIKEKTWTDSKPNILLSNLEIQQYVYYNIYFCLCVPPDVNVLYMFDVHIVLE